MSDKQVLFKIKEERLTYDAAVLMGQFADAIKAGELEIESEDGVALVTFGGNATLEISMKRKVKESGVKNKLSMELKWIED